MGKTDWKNDKLPIFNSNKYGTIRENPLQPGERSVGKTNNGAWVRKDGTVNHYMPNFIDGSDAMANRGFIVSFQHVPSENDVSFKAFITAFNETYNCDWAAEQVYGRADPIYMYKSTGREITLAINIPAATEGEAFENLGRVQELVRFLYPSYAGSGYKGTESSYRGAGGGRKIDDGVNALTIANSPLVRLRVMNILAARPQIGDMAGGTRQAEALAYTNLGTFEEMVSNPGSETSVNTSAIGSQTIAENWHGGILGVIKNLTVNHNLDNVEHGAFEVANGTLLPKMIDINISFGVIHEHTTGWLQHRDGQQFANGLFPYGINLEKGRLNNEVQDPAVLQKRNFDQQERIQNRLDQLAEEAEQTQQDRANAEARYAGAFGKARFNRDKNRIKNENDRQANIKGKLADVKKGSRKERRLNNRLDRSEAREDYYESAQRGVADAGGWNEFVE